MGKLQEFDITFTNNKVVYGPGEAISGTVRIRTGSSLPYKGKRAVPSTGGGKNKRFFFFFFLLASCSRCCWSSSIINFVIVRSLFLMNVSSWRRSGLGSAGTESTRLRPVPVHFSVIRPHPAASVSLRVANSQNRVSPS